MKSFLRASPLCAALALLTLCAAGPAKAQADPIVIGAHIPSTGANADPGARLQRAYQMLVDEVNARGGVKGRRLRLAMEDDRNDPTTVRAAIDRLATRDKAVAILGTYGSANGVAGAQQAERYQIPNIQPFTSNPQITSSGYKYVFNLTAGDDVRWTTILSYLLDVQKKARVAAISIEGIHLASFKGLRDITSQKGATILAEEVMGTKQIDMNAMVTRIKETKPDILIYNATTAQSIQIHRSLKQLGVNIPWVARSPSFGTDKDLMDALGTDLDYVIGLDEWYPEAKFPGNEDFVRNFQSKHGYLPTRIESKGYATAQLLVAALEKSPSISPDAIRDTLMKGDLGTIIGPMNFSSNGQRKPENLVGQIQAGKVVILWPASVKTGDPRPAPDWASRK